MSDPAPGVGAREERYRLASMAASVPLLLLDAPVVLSVDGRRSLAAEALHEPLAWFVVFFLVAWPLLVAVVSLGHGRRRQIPGTAIFALPALLYTLCAGGVAVVLSLALIVERNARREPLVGLVALTAWIAVYLLLRGFRRAGWERWAQLVAGVWLGHGTVASLMLFADASPLAGQHAGGWLFLFALGSLSPIVAWILWPRRGETPLWRSTPPRPG